MRPVRISWLRVAGATVAAAAACFPLGMAAAYVWTHFFVAFGAFMLLALLSLRLHPFCRRVAGVPVVQDSAVASEPSPVVVEGIAA